MPRLSNPDFQGEGDKMGDCWESEAKEEYLLGEKEGDEDVPGLLDLERMIEPYKPPKPQIYRIGSWQSNETSSSEGR